MKKNQKQLGALPKYSSLLNVMAEFDAAAEHLKLTADQITLVKEPRLSIKVKLPVLMDNSHIQTFRAYHSVHSFTRGPAIGALQFRSNIELETVEALAFWSTHRSALLNIPFGGSAGAVICNPTMYSNGEIERISRRYLAELSSLIKPQNDVMTADIGTNPQTMCWMMDTYSMHKNNFSPSVVLGKPSDLGGLNTPDYPTSIGAELCIKKACELMGISVKGATVAIQGFGKVGMNIAKLLYNAGAKIQAVADISGAYVNTRGINLDEVVWHQQSHGILDGLEGEVKVEKLSDSLKIMELPVDILIPAAVELQITEQNMTNIKAKIIAEIAHDPVSPIADQFLHKLGTLIIPDILCSAGGLVGYYLEWVQNRTAYCWRPNEVKTEIERIVGNAFDAVKEISTNESISFRLASAVLAVKRFATAASYRGMYA